MTLIDHFNAFQAFCECRGFTANARSLYYALLAEFNKRRFPDEAKLSNSYLQQISGITARSSFDAARNVLISTNVIKHKRSKYALVTPVKIVNDGGYIWEYPPKEAAPPAPATVTPEPAPPNPCVDSGPDDWLVYAKKFISPEVLNTWLNCSGEILKGNKILDLKNMVQVHGVEKVIAAIETASIDCNYKDFPNLTYKFFKMKLDTPNPPKGGRPNGNRPRNSDTAGDTSQYAGFDFG